MKTLLVCVLLGGLCGVANAAPKAADAVASEVALTAEIAQHKAAIKELQAKRKAIKAEVRKAKRLEKARNNVKRLEAAATNVLPLGQGCYVEESREGAFLTVCDNAGVR